jgi:hypothetical protein
LPRAEPSVEERATGFATLPGDFEVNMTGILAISLGEVAVSRKKQVRTY